MAPNFRLDLGILHFFSLCLLAEKLKRAVMTQVDDTIEMKQMVKSTPCYLYRFVACQLPKTPRLLRSLCGQVSYVLCQPIQLCGRRDLSWPQILEISGDLVLEISCLLLSQLNMSLSYPQLLRV